MARPNQWGGTGDFTEATCIPRMRNGNAAMPHSPYEETGSIYTVAFCACERSSGGSCGCAAHMTQASYAPPLAWAEPLA